MAVTQSSAWPPELLAEFRAWMDREAEKMRLAELPCPNGPAHSWEWQRSLWDPQGKAGLGWWCCECGAEKMGARP